MARKRKRWNEKQIIRAAERAAKKKHVSEEGGLRRLKIQTASPGKRIGIAAISLIPLGIAFLSQGSCLPLAIAFYIVGAALVACAIFGNKKTVDSVLNGMDAGASDRILERILDSIINGLL